MSIQHAVAPVRLPDDREEDLVGTDWHQHAIVGVFDGLLDLADTLGLPWHVGNQLALVGWSPNGAQWRPLPDIMVHQDAGPEPRSQMVVLDDGPPALIIEVASDTTWEHDVDTLRGKAAGYPGIGIQYYLVFDPTGEYLQELARGWRLTPDGVQPWLPDADGTYRCDTLGIGLRPEGSMLRVIDAAGEPVPTRAERLYALAEQSERLDAQAAELEAQAAELEAGQQANAAQAEAIATQAKMIATLHRENAALRAQIARLFGGQSSHDTALDGEDQAR